MLVFVFRRRVARAFCWGGRFAFAFAFARSRIGSRARESVVDFFSGFRVNRISAERICGRWYSSTGNRKRY